MFKTLSDTDDFTNILKGLGLHPKRLLSFFHVFRCEIEKNGEIDDAMKLAGLAGKEKPDSTGFALVVESTLCLQGADISLWAATWSKALRAMQLTNKLPELDKIFPDFDELSSATAHAKSGKEHVWVLPQESDAVEVKTEATRLNYGQHNVCV